MLKHEYSVHTFYLVRIRGMYYHAWFTSLLNIKDKWNTGHIQNLDQFATSGIKKELSM